MPQNLSGIRTVRRHGAPSQVAVRYHTDQLLTVKNPEEAHVPFVHFLRRRLQAVTGSDDLHIACHYLLDFMPDSFRVQSVVPGHTRRFAWRSGWNSNTRRLPPRRGR